MRIVLCDNGLAHRRGHHYNCAAGIREELEARAVPLLLLSNVAIDRALRSELDAVPTFTCSPYESLRASMRRGELRRCIRAALRFRSELRRSEIRSDDIVFVPLARPAEVLGLAAVSWPATQRPAAVILNFMTEEFGPRVSRERKLLVQVLFRLGLGLLRRRLRGRRMLLSSPSASLASSLSHRTGRRVFVGPMLKSYPPPVARADGASCVIGFLGTPRSDKGGGLLADVVDNCARAHPAACVIAQLSDGSPDSWRGWPANVEVLPVGLDRERYFDVLRRIDVAVLPYAPTRFSTPSGVFAEAVACGAATVVPSGSWMAAMLEQGRGAGVVFEGFSVETITGAVGQAVRRLDELRSRAGTLSGRWRAEQSISAYLTQALGELDAGGLKV